MNVTAVRNHSENQTFISKSISDDLDGTSFFDCVNDANMSLLSLCKLAQRHRVVADNQYWILQRVYLMNNVTGEYESALTGIYPIDPP